MMFKSECSTRQRTCAPIGAVAGVRRDTAASFERGAVAREVTAANRQIRQGRGGHDLKGGGDGECGGEEEGQLHVG